MCVFVLKTLPIHCWSSKHCINKITTIRISNAADAKRLRERCATGNCLLFGFAHMINSQSHTKRSILSHSKSNHLSWFPSAHQFNITFTKCQTFPKHFTLTQTKNEKRTTPPTHFSPPRECCCLDVLMSTEFLAVIKHETG